MRRYTIEMIEQMLIESKRDQCNPSHHATVDLVIDRMKKQQKKIKALQRKVEKVEKEKKDCENLLDQRYPFVMNIPILEKHDQSKQIGVFHPESRQMIFDEPIDFTSKVFYPGHKIIEGEKTKKTKKVKKIKIFEISMFNASEVY